MSNEIAKTLEPTEIGKRIRRIRRERDLTQAELADRLNVTKATINKYELGVVKNLPRDRISALANALQVSPAYLLGWTDHTQYKPNAQTMASMIAEAAANDTNTQMHEAVAAIFDDVVDYAINPTYKRELNQPCAAVPASSSHVTDEEGELLRIFRSLSVRDRMKLLQFAFDMEDVTKNEQVD